MHPKHNKKEYKKKNQGVEKKALFYVFYVQGKTFVSIISFPQFFPICLFSNKSMGERKTKENE